MIYFFKSTDDVLTQRAVFLLYNLCEKVLSERAIRVIVQVYNIDPIFSTIKYSQ